MAAANTTKRKADLKVVILGAANVGKTTLIHRYIHGTFQETISTIGASFSLKQWGPYNIALWDTAGEERFSGLSSFYCRGAGAAILAFDVTSRESFQQLSERFLGLLESADDNCLCVVVGTKLDLLSPDAPRPVKQEEGFQFAKRINQSRPQELPYFETSSVSDQNVNRVFEYIFDTLLPLQGGDRPRYVRKSPSGVVDLEGDSPDKSKGGAGAGKSKCC